MSFEKALKELESIVGRLERGDVELEESITIYERGEALKEHCDRLLKQAEARVEKLTFNQAGEPDRHRAVQAAGVNAEAQSGVAVLRRHDGLMAQYASAIAPYGPPARRERARAPATLRLPDARL